jgi:hypothetical protein
LRDSPLSLCTPRCPHCGESPADHPGLGLAAEVRPQHRVRWFKTSRTSPLACTTAAGNSRSDTSARRRRAYRCRSIAARPVVSRAATRDQSRGLARGCCSDFTAIRERPQLAPMQFHAVKAHAGEESEDTIESQDSGISIGNSRIGLLAELADAVDSKSTGTAQKPQKNKRFQANRRFLSTVCPRRYIRPSTCRASEIMADAA